MSDIVTFIKARLDEDEAAARAADVKQGDPSWVKHGPVALSSPRAFRIRSQRDARPVAYVEDVAGDGDAETTDILDAEAAATHIARHDPARVLAEVEAKVAIVDTLTSRERADDSEEGLWHKVGYGRAAFDVLRLLAQPYADHGEYLEEWRP